MYTINSQQRATSCKTPEIETPLKPPIAAAQGQFGGKMEVGPGGLALACIRIENARISAPLSKSAAA
jgi:hypothetical protein